MAVLILANYRCDQYDNRQKDHIDGDPRFQFHRDDCANSDQGTIISSISLLKVPKISSMRVACKAL